MPYGKLNQKQINCIVPVITNRTVHDLGAGDCVLSQNLLMLGAKEVIAIEKEDGINKPNVSGLIHRKMYFHEMNEDIDVAFLSWPANYDTRVVQVLRRANTIIYLGINDGMTACGTPKLFQYFLTRKVIAYIPGEGMLRSTRDIGACTPQNTMIVYGGDIDVLRAPLDGELLALEVW